MSSDRKDIPEREYHVGYHIVCLIDILGQQDALAAWAKMPRSPEDRPAFIQALQNTVGTVKEVSRTFRDYFANFENGPPMPGLNEVQQATLNRMRSCKLSVQQFSDTLVFYATILNEHGDMSVEVIFRAFSACALMMGFSLTKGIPVRGAICLGTGIEVDPNNFYGPALSIVHHLESEVAKYPRILVSQELVAYVQTATSFSANAIVDELNKAQLTLCQKLLARDQDGHHVIDFLGAGMREAAGNDPSVMKIMANAAHKFVNSELQKFRDIHNHNLADRYARLLAYIESRLPLWT